MRKMTILLAAVLLLGGCGRESGGPEKGARQDARSRYNVVLIVSDALRYDLPGCDGGPADTPNINRLAASGVRFTRAHAASPWTMPSSVALLTGRHATVFPTDEEGPVPGRDNYHVPAGARFLPRILQELGYELVFSGYNPNAWLAGNVRGFRRVEPPHPDGYAPGTCPDSLAALAALVPFDYGSRLHRRMTGFLEFLSTAGPESRFFAVNWFDDPHAPYDPEPAFMRRVARPYRRLTRRPRYYKNQVNMHLFDHFEKASLTPVEIEYFRALYRAEVESVDERVGMILSLLDERGLRDDTIVVFTADHGEGFNEHGMFEHGRSYYQELLHVPLIVSGPGVPAGEVVDAPVSLVDLMATLREMLGVTGPPEEPAPGFRYAWADPDRDSRPLYFDGASDLTGNDCRDAVLDGSFKLITHQGDDRVELYDLRNDPGEQTDLAAADTTRVADLRRLLVEFRRHIAQQRARNAAAAGLPDSLSDAEREEILKKLRSLGYVN